MRKTRLFLIIILGVALLSGCTNSDSDSSNESSSETTTILTVQGMVCSRCENAVNREVSTLEGVIDVSVDLRRRTVTVEHDLDVEVDDIKDRIMNAGFTPVD